MKTAQVPAVTTGSYRDHPHDRRDVLPLGNLHACVALAAKPPFPARQPSPGRAAPIQARAPVTLTVTREKALFLDSAPVTLDTLAGTLKPMMEVSHGNIIVAADSAAPQGAVVQAMLQARYAGAEHFLIAVKYNE